MSIACSSAVSVIRAPVSGTRLTQTRTFTRQLRTRVFSGSNSGREPATATVTG